MTCSVLRLAAFLLVIEFGVVLYYLLNDTIGLYRNLFHVCNPHQGRD